MGVLPAPESGFGCQNTDLQLLNAAPLPSEFISTLHLVREEVGINERLTTKALETVDNLYSSPPGGSSPTSPTPPQADEEQAGGCIFQESTTSSINVIRNPPVPGPLEPTAEALYTRVNTFVKENGFAIIKRNGLTRKDRLIRYTFECDRYGEPRVNKKKAGLRERR